MAPGMIVVMVFEDEDSVIEFDEKSAMDLVDDWEDRWAWESRKHDWKEEQDYRKEQRKKVDREKARARLRYELGQDPDEVSETLLDEFIDDIVLDGEVCAYM